MTVAVVLGLVLLGACDGAFSGLRASFGRTGLVDHRADDVVARRRGLALLAVLLLPAAALALVQPGDATDAGAAMLAVYAPYGALVLAALVAWRTLSWRVRFLASALVLGPFTWVRPVVAVAGGVLGCWQADRAVTQAAVVLAVAAVLAVQPLADHLWYAP